jgi:CRISPR-associated endoribonuclease Cas6
VHRAGVEVRKIRLYIESDCEGEPKFLLPWNYHLSFQSFVYDALGKYEPELASELHQHPDEPPFSFSEFIPTGPYQTMEDGLTATRGYWVVTSDDKRIIDAVANYARHDGMLELGQTRVPVKGVDIEEIEGSTETRYKTLSPVYVSQRDSDGKVEDLFPQDGMWYARLRDSVRDRMDAKDLLPDDFEFVVDEIHWTKKKRLRAGDGWRSCTRLEATIRSDNETSRFIQTQGLGEKTGMGFGSVMPTNQVPAEWR